MKVLEPGDLGQGCQGGAEARYLQSGLRFGSAASARRSLSVHSLPFRNTLCAVCSDRKHLGIEGKTVENQPDGLLTGNAHGAC
jgi:hypothetical protein